MLMTPNHRISCSLLHFHIVGLTLDNSLLEVSLTEECGSSSLVTQQVATAPKTVFDRLQQGRKVTHNVKAGLFGTAIENDEDDDDDDGQEGYDEEYVQQDEDGNDGQVQFAVTMNKHQHSLSTKVVQPYRQVVYHDNRNNSGTYNGRGKQPYTHNGGNSRPINKRNSSNNNRNVKGVAKQVVSSVDLDNDLDSYFAAK